MSKTLAIVFGIVFVLVGLLGFVDNPLVGEGSIFHTDMMHNAVHIAFGIILLIAAATGAAALWLKVLGVAYLALAVIGFSMAPEGGMLLGLAEANTADHWLHVILGIVLVGGSFADKGLPKFEEKIPGTTSGE